MNTTEILSLNTTKTEKIKLLLAQGYTRKQVATLMGVGYGFVQNVYAKVYGVANPRQQRAFRFDRTFGVEIEAFGPSILTVQRAISAAGVSCTAEHYNHTTRSHWKIVTDASVPGGFEVVSPVLKGQDGLDQLEKVCKALGELGVKVNRSCGLHVHFGASDFCRDVQVWKNLFLNYATLEETIDSMMPQSRRGGNNQFCRSLKVANWKEKIEQANTLEEMERRLTGRSRYFKLNSQSFWRHKTIEFRQHSGTIEFEKISNWISFCARLLEFSRKGKRVDASFESTTRFLDQKTHNFYKARRLKFAA